MANFIKKVWNNRITEYPNRRLLTKTDGSTEVVDVSRQEGSVSQEGDAFSKENMDGLEERIYNALAGSPTWMSATDFINKYGVGSIPFSKGFVNIYGTSVPGTWASDTYYFGVDSDRQCYSGSQLNGATTVTWDKNMRKSDFTVNGDELIINLD